MEKTNDVGDDDDYYHYSHHLYPLPMLITEHLPYAVESTWNAPFSFNFQKILWDRDYLYLHWEALKGHIYCPRSHRMSTLSYFVSLSPIKQLGENEILKLYRPETLLKFKELRATVAWVGGKGLLERIVFERRVQISTEHVLSDR